MLKKLIAIFFLLPAMALAASFVEGKDYQIVSNPNATNNKNKAPMIEEFFSYGCPWCYKIEAPSILGLVKWVITFNSNAFQLYLNHPGSSMPKPTTPQKRLHFLIK